MNSAETTRSAAGANDAGTGGPTREVTDVGAVVDDSLACLADQPVSEHVAVFDGVHRLLQDALATLDEV